MESNISMEYEAQLAELGITHTLVDQFNYQQFKYTNLKDALEQARRHNADRTQLLLTEKQDLPKHGITHERQPCFRFRQYQYSNSQDAIAQASREKKMENAEER